MIRTFSDISLVLVWITEPWYRYNPTMIIMQVEVFQVWVIVVLNVNTLTDLYKKNTLLFKDFGSLNLSK